MYHILVCDDEKDIVTALGIYLKSDGYQVYEAYNGKEALDIIRKEEILEFLLRKTLKMFRKIIRFFLKQLIIC